MSSDDAGAVLNQRSIPPGRNIHCVDVFDQWVQFNVTAACRDDTLREAAKHSVLVLTNATGKRRCISMQHDCEILRGQYDNLNDIIKSAFKQNFINQNKTATAQRIYKRKVQNIRLRQV